MSSKDKLSRLFPVICLIAMLILGGCVANNADTTDEANVESSEDVFAIGLNPDRDYLIVVNDDNEYKFGGEYDKALQPDLIYVSDSDGVPTPIEKGTNTAFTLLKQRLRTQGVDIELYSGYRTKEDQEWVYDYYSNLEGWGDTNKVAKAGFSEHHTGLLLNIVAWMPDEENPDEYVWTTETAKRQEENPSFKVIHENLADFGFIDRYPAGKEDITGYPSEPYEIRFVGSSKVAHEIMDNNLCLEEYLESK